MTDRVRTEDNERIDRPDFDAACQLLDGGGRATGRAVGEGGLFATHGFASGIGCTLAASAIAYDVPGAGDITVSSGLRVLCAAPAGNPGTEPQDGTPNGDVLELATNVIIAGGAPDVVNPIKYLMARPSLLTAGDYEARVFKNLAAPPAEFTAKINTRFTRTVDLIVVNNLAAAHVQYANGYESVAAMDWNGGAGYLTAWMGRFQDVTNAATYPRLALESAAQAIRALAAELAVVKGVAWDAIGVDSILGLYGRAVKTARRFRGDGVGGLVDVSGYNAGVTAIAGAALYTVPKTVVGAGTRCVGHAIDPASPKTPYNVAVDNITAPGSLAVAIQTWNGAAWVDILVEGTTTLYVDVIEFA